MYHSAAVLLPQGVNLQDPCDVELKKIDQFGFHTTYDSAGSNFWQWQHLYYINIENLLYP